MTYFMYNELKSRWNFQKKCGNYFGKSRTDIIYGAKLNTSLNILNNIWIRISYGIINDRSLDTIFQ